MSNRFRSRWLVTLFVLATIVWLSEPATATQDPESGAYATKIVEAMGNFIESAAQLSFTITSVHTETMADGIPFQLVTETRVALRRPDRFWVDTHSEQVHNRFLYDGQRVTLHHLIANSYASVEAPATIDATFTMMEEKFGMFIPFTDIIAGDASRRIMDEVKAITYLGIDNIDGVSCHHLFARQEDLDWEAWIEDGIMLVPRKIAIYFKNDEGNSTYTALLSEWDFSPHLHDAVFTQTHPLGARRIELQQIVGEENP
jgi:hypothetical protein